MPNFPFKSYCWSLGTTSFRTKRFNKTIELQLSMLNDFWSDAKRQKELWQSNNSLQADYYDFMQERCFVVGDATRKDKDAREKTSGLVDIGLLDDNRRITEAGKALLKISQTGDFEPDNTFKIPKDSFIYLKQLLKTSVPIDGVHIRPMLVLIHLLSELKKLTYEEFTYLLPLCISEETTNQIIKNISLKTKGIDEIIINVLLSKDNYKEALKYFLEANEVTTEVLCDVGMNRKSRSYDKPYLPLYNEAFHLFYRKDYSRISHFCKALSGIKLNKWWRTYLFDTSSATAIENLPQKHIKPNKLAQCTSVAEFRKAFFILMHLFKAKATLSDYNDLNRRYFKTTDIFLFADSEVKMDLIPQKFFETIDQQLFLQAFSPCQHLKKNCTLEEISPCLKIEESAILVGIENELGITINSIDEVSDVLEKERYNRFITLIDNHFTDKNLLYLLDCFDQRNDDEINRLVTENADSPTIFEYVLGIIWYKLSGCKGKILDYLKLSLDADLLPVTHAAGGEADIVYEYQQSSTYPKHTVLLEATLADGTNQRRMEMEPVSRHLGNYILRTNDHNAYCVFVSNFLHPQVISDFRSRKHTYYYDTQNDNNYIESMKIIPLNTNDLKAIISEKIRYNDLYVKFEDAYNAGEDKPKEWYDNYIKFATEPIAAEPQAPYGEKE